MFIRPFLLALSGAVFLLPSVECGPTGRALSTSSKSQSVTTTTSRPNSLPGAYSTSQQSKPPTPTTSVTHTIKPTTTATSATKGPTTSTKTSIKTSVTSTTTTSFVPNPSCGTKLKKFVLRAAAAQEDGVVGRYLFNDDSTGINRLSFNTTSIQKAQQFSFGPNCTIVNGPEALVMYYGELVFKQDPAPQRFEVPYYTDMFTQPYFDQCSVNAKNVLNCHVRDLSYFKTVGRELYIGSGAKQLYSVTVMLQPAPGSS